MSSFLSRVLSKFRPKKTSLPAAEKEDDHRALVFREQLQKHYSEGRMDLALELLIQAEKKDAVLLKRQYEEGKEHFEKGRIAFAEWSQIQARIYYAMMNIK